jgi:hypothetical protein
MEPKTIRQIVDLQSLPINYPTHQHPTEFWEWLGRTVATFGFLEFVLARAVLVFTGTKQVNQNEVEIEFEKWYKKMKSALSDTLNPLIDKYAAAVKSNAKSSFANLGRILVNSAIFHFCCCRMHPRAL